MRFLAYTGLRWGEVSALRVSRLDLLRRRVTVAAAFAEVGGELVEGTPKNHQRRSVPIPRFLVDELAAHIAGKRPDARGADYLRTGTTNTGVIDLGKRRGPGR